MRTQCINNIFNYLEKKESWQRRWGRRSRASSKTENKFVPFLGMQETIQATPIELRMIQQERSKLHETLSGLKEEKETKTMTSTSMKTMMMNQKKKKNSSMKSYPNQTMKLNRRCLYLKEQKDVYQERSEPSKISIIPEDSSKCTSALIRKNVNKMTKLNQVVFNKLGGILTKQVQ